MSRFRLIIDLRHRESRISSSMSSLKKDAEQRGEQPQAKQSTRRGVPQCARLALEGNCLYCASSSAPVSTAMSSGQHHPA